MDISSLALALGSSLTAGLNLYITVLTLGLMHRYEILSLPGQLEGLSNPWVMAAAAVLLVIEFVADKVPYVDNIWDSVHTFIRVPAGAFLASSAMGDAPSHITWIAALLGGFVTLTSHGAKTSTRLAVNSTPEPFTNWFLSITEDVLSLGLLWLVSSHPYVAVVSALILLLIFFGLIYMFYRFLKYLFRRPRPAPRTEIYRPSR
ncbi:MAG: DUF4126 domain-containing protein [Acidobacteria bacterium]|nr:MAG: DUF4126 domain-containing protein [Acidobacteriota bacterium]